VQLERNIRNVRLVTVFKFGRAASGQLRIVVNSEEVPEASEMYRELLKAQREVTTTTPWAIILEGSTCENSSWVGIVRLLAMSSAFFQLSRMPPEIGGSRSGADAKLSP
jgi:hypothetical protein